MWFVYGRKVSVVVLFLIVAVIAALMLGGCSVFTPASQPTAAVSTATATATLRPLPTATWWFTKREPFPEEVTQRLVSITPAEPVIKLIDKSDHRWQRLPNKKGPVCIEILSAEVQITIIYAHEPEAAYVYYGKQGDKYCNIKFFVIRHLRFGSTFVRNPLNLMAHEIRWGANLSDSLIVYNANLPIAEGDVNYVTVDNAHKLVGGRKGEWTKVTDQHLHLEVTVSANMADDSVYIIIPQGGYFWFIGDDRKRIDLEGYTFDNPTAHVYIGELFVLLPPKQPGPEPKR